MKKVRNSAMPIKTWLGGVCCIANADRISDRTTTIRVNEVIINRKAGAKDKAESNNKICMPVDRFASPAFLSPISILGKVILT